MKRFLTLALAVAVLTGCAGMTVEQQELAEFAIETMAMGIAYDLRNSFEMTPEIQRYFAAIEAGQISLEGAKMAEGYLKKITHPILANRFVRLSAMVGFDLDAANNLIGAENVNIKYLQVAAAGFKQGLALD